MVKHSVVVCCWDYGHENEIMMTRKQEDKLERQIPQLKAVCPTCRDQELGNQPIFIKEGQSQFNAPKVYACRHGHVTTIGAFANGMLHVKFGHADDDYMNIEGTIEELEELVDKKEIACHHVRDNGRVCNCKLKAVDSFSLQYPGSAGVKTTTRIGDIWDRAGAEPVRTGEYDKEGHYHATKTEVANRKRLERMRERNIPEEKHPGKRINKATKKDYGRRSKSEVNPERLNRS